MPVWCVDSGISPYDQVSDAIIERDLPLLTDRPSLKLIDFAFLESVPLLLLHGLRLFIVVAFQNQF